MNFEVSMFGAYCFFGLNILSYWCGKCKNVNTDVKYFTEKNFYLSCVSSLVYQITEIKGAQSVHTPEPACMSGNIVLSSVNDDFTPIL